MNARRLKNSLSMMTTGLVLMNTAWAGIPVWTFAPVSGYPPSVSVSSSGAATIKYTVTNQSHKLHTLKMKPIQGITSSGCTSPLGYHQSCTLTLAVSGSGGSGDATNVVVSTSGLPSDASVSPSSCGTITASGGTCEITVTPGETASANANGFLCTTGVQPEGSVNVTADDGLSVSVATYVLSYGCIYQGGFVYSVDDTTPNTGSIGGKVSSLVDQAAPHISYGPQATSIIWASKGAGATSADVDYTIILGIDETSTSSVPSPTSPAYPVGTPAYTACNGASDGACDSGNILSYYNFNRAIGGSAPLP